MKKIFLIAVAMLFALPSFGQAPYYYQRTSLFESLPVMSKDIVFLGDSITDHGEWSELFGNKNIKNRGISADRAVWLGNRLDPIVEGRPKKLFVLIGTNDLSAGVSVEQVAESIGVLIDRFAEDSPKTKVYIQSVFPVDVANERYANAQDRNEQILRLNRMIVELCDDKDVAYIDVHSALKDKDGNLRGDLSNDGLHLTGKGYMVWKKVVEPYVK